MSTDEEYLSRAIRLAMNGRGRVEPNPMVGCVLVKNGRVIGEGIHEKFGGPHAEPNALAACIAAGESPAGATAYVTLEPCCHLNKKTPPCAPQLIAANVKRVVIGCLDPNPAVNGAGVAMLRTAGIAVDGPILESRCKQLIAPFLLSVNQHRPYVTLKWAESANGMVAGRQGAPVRITNPTSDRIVHELRGRCDAIAVGTNTVLSDDPLLSVRDAPALRPLLRVVLSNTLKIPLSSRLVQTARQWPLLIFCSMSAAATLANHVLQLRNAGAEVVAVAGHDSAHFSMEAVFRELNNRGVTHLLVEPGPTLARSMIERQQADRLWIFRSPQPIPEVDGLPAARMHGVFSTSYVTTAEINLESDVLSELLNKQSAGFFAPVASADATLAADEMIAAGASQRDIRH
jgi:diaminohydroxyphosphoribosylaminopyrimidine deaminase/5-amino-6-(5-phosphoribosylamino)uracil reductase